MYWPFKQKKLIYFPFDNYEGKISGPRTFMSNLQNYLDKSKYSYTKDLDKAAGIFFPISYYRDKLQQLKKKEVKIIQRLDGVYYPEKHGENFEERNGFFSDIYTELADYVIFQSDYSLKQCFKILGEKPKEQYSIIVNGVDTEIFFPKSKVINELDSVIKFVTTGNFRNIDMLEPVIIALDSLAEKYKFELTIMGPVSDELKKYTKRKYIKVTESNKLEDVAAELNKNDIFLYSHLNTPCPNSVLEAIAVGLPVVGFDSGAIKELSFFNKDLLTFVSDDIFQKYSDFNPKLLAEKIELCINNFEEYKIKSMQYIDYYAFSKCGKAYIEVFNKILNV